MFFHRRLDLKNGFSCKCTYTQNIQRTMQTFDTGNNQQWLDNYLRASWNIHEKIPSPHIFFQNQYYKPKKLHLSEVNKYALHYHAWASCSFMLQRDTEYIHTPLALVNGNTLLVIRIEIFCVKNYAKTNSASASWFQHHPTEHHS